MATQTGLHLAAPNEPYTIVSTIPVPVPGPKQILVRSLVTGVNPVSVSSPSVYHNSTPQPSPSQPSPIHSRPPPLHLLSTPLPLPLSSLLTNPPPSEPLMQHTGANILSPYPAILGCEASGVVVRAGASVTRFAPGDFVFGCTRVGESEYATFQEHFLMDEEVAYHRPAGMSAEQASTLGVALDVSFPPQTKADEVDGVDGTRVQS